MAGVIFYSLKSDKPTLFSGKSEKPILNSLNINRPKTYSLKEA